MEKITKITPKEDATATTPEVPAKVEVQNELPTPPKMTLEAKQYLESLTARKANLETMLSQINADIKKINDAGIT